MAIVLQTSPLSAISTLSDLVTEIRDELDDDGFETDRIYRALALSEARFNRELRVPQMVATAVLTVLDGEGALPADCLQVRYVGRYLQNTSPVVLNATYGTAEGERCAYTLEGQTIRVAMASNDALSLTYYQRINPLSEDSPQNWLLEESADLYLHHALALIYKKLGDGDDAAMHLGIANDILEQVKRDGISRQYGAGRLAPRIVNQVRGASA